MDSLNRQGVHYDAIFWGFQANALNQYVEVGGVGVSYDGNFNLAAFNGATFSYNAQSQLMSGSKGGKTVSFTYDGLGRKVKRVVTGSAGGTTITSYDGWKPLVDYDPSGNLLAANLYGPGADEILVRWVSALGTHLRYHHDVHGNVMFILDDSGQLVERYSYDAFGTPTVLSWNPTTHSWDNSHPDSTAYGNRFMFQGRDWFPELGIYDYRHRDYFPQFGRFLQMDPSGFEAGDMNLFRYCDDDPVDRNDPTGLIAIDAASTIWNRLKVFDTISFGTTSLSELDKKISDTARFYDSFRALTDTSRRDARSVDPATIGRAAVKDAQAAGGKTAGDIHNGHGINSGQERTYAEYVNGRSLDRKGPRLGKSYANTGRQADIPGYVDGGPKPITIAHSHGPGSPRGFDNFDIPSANGGSLLRTPYVSSLQHYLDHTTQGGPVLLYVPGGGLFRSSDGETFSFIR